MKVLFASSEAYPFAMSGGLADVVGSLPRFINKDEYDEVVKYAIDLGVENAFVQEDDTADESFIPDFNTKVII